MEPQTNRASLNKPENIDHQSAYLVGSGLAALSAACFLVRDGHMQGNHVHIFEKDRMPGGSCDGFEYPGIGYVTRMYHAMDPHFDVIQDLFHSIPSEYFMRSVYMNKQPFHPYETVVLPMVRFLQSQGVQFHYLTHVMHVNLEKDSEGHTHVTRLDLMHHEEEIELQLTDDDLVLITLGDRMENASMGSQYYPADLRTTLSRGGAWELWRDLAREQPNLGHPDAFCQSPDKSARMSASLTTLDDRIPSYMEKITHMNAFSGDHDTKERTFASSPWDMSWLLPPQPQFSMQPQAQCVLWISGTASDQVGDYVKKSMRECTGKEICMEWLYQLGVKESEIPMLAEHSARTIPVMMPYVMSPFLSNCPEDRPKVVPAGAVNYALIGQFVELTGVREITSTPEYAMYTGREATYKLLGLERTRET